MSTHNLDIHTYSLNEIFALFDIVGGAESLNVEILKRAKKKVLMIHPDKSKLPPDYFLFYKKAFDIVVKFFEEQNRQAQKITQETTNYNVQTGVHENQIRGAIDNMSRQEFQSKFNRLFDENMATRPDTTRNEWFRSETPQFEVAATTPKNMGAVFDKIKETQHSMVNYRGGVATLHSGNSGTHLYDDEDAVDDGAYVTSDPFSKLKYDDLRKVHKDQTVFMVSERDFAKVPQYASVDHYSRERGGQNLTPLEKTEAERVLADENRQYREYIRQKEYHAELKTQKNAEKNKSILSNFLRIGI
jgi:hypothetical protein